MLQGQLCLNFSNYKDAPSPSVYNLLILFMFNYGTTIALLEGACFERMQEDVL
jgi:hypothetical protein